MKITLTILLCLLTAAHARAFTLSGNVVDQSTNEPVETAYVFLASSTIGTITDAQGQFKLNVTAPGNYQLVVSHVSYETNAADIVVNGNIANLAISLSPKAVMLKDVTVTGTDKYRELNYKTFKEVILGKTPNSAHCEIEMPQKISLRRTWIDSLYTPKLKDSIRRLNDAPLSRDMQELITAVSELEARADEFIVIRNKRLGYILRYKLEHFVCGPSRITFFGYPYFEDIVDKCSNPKRVYKNRMEVYKGSAQHFFRSLYNNTLDGSGFSTYKLDEEINPKHARSFSFFPFYNPVTRQNHVLYPKNELVNLSPMVEDDTIAGAKRLTYNQSFEVEYNDNILPGYSKYRAKTKAPSWEPVLQSTLFIRYDTCKPVVFYNNGSYDIASRSLSMTGYMTWKRLADMLPLDFDAEGTESLLSPTN